jgi:tetratricopeptide (TPR) repeat protein
MFLSEPESDQMERSDISRNPDVVVVENSSAGLEVSQPGRSNMPVRSDANKQAKMSERRIGTRWWMLAAGFAVLLALLAAAGIYLLSRNSSTVDELVIYTVPSGAEITLNSKSYGHSPVKIEQLPWGAFDLTITKEGFEPIREVINVSEPQHRFEYTLKALLPSGMSPEQAIVYYQEQAKSAFDHGKYWAPNDESALKYVADILTYDSSNQFALDMKESIRKQLHQNAQAARARGDIAQAQDLYGVLLRNFPEDREVYSAATELTNQIKSQGNQKIADFTRKGYEALQAGNLIEPPSASAYYYARQVLAIDRANTDAQRIRDEVISSLGGRTDVERVTRDLERAVQLYPQDLQLYGLLESFRTKRDEIARENDPRLRREQGLKKYRYGEYRAAIPDLEQAYYYGHTSTDVRFALAHSYMEVDRLDDAAKLFRTFGSNDNESYRSSIAALGDIAFMRGQPSTALDHYKKARALGGSILYPVNKLDDKIERIEKQQRAKAAEPVPYTIHVKHPHGTLKGSCTGTLTVDSNGVRFDSREHPSSYSLMGVSVKVEKDGLVLILQRKEEKFRATRADSEQFRQVLNRYQKPPTGDQ